MVSINYLVATDLDAEGLIVTVLIVPLGRKTSGTVAKGKRSEGNS